MCGHREARITSDPEKQQGEIETNPKQTEIRPEKKKVIEEGITNEREKEKRKHDVQEKIEEKEKCNNREQSQERKQNEKRKPEVTHKEPETKVTQGETIRQPTVTPSGVTKNIIKQKKITPKPNLKSKMKANKKLSATQTNKINSYFKITNREGPRGADRDLPSKNKSKSEDQTDTRRQEGLQRQDEST